ncbi:MAG: hypothetical protein DI605_11010 [Sphingomonas sp.]|nr:MAG: hypothetical protein DI605_11010 [Sphingomonas sp.]
MLDALAAPLVEAGHTVTLAAKDLVTVAALPNPRFARVIQAPLYLRRPPRRTATITYGQVIADAGFAEPQAIEALVKAWLVLFDLAKPDMIVAEHAPVSLLAAHIAGIPVVRIGTAFSAPPAIRPMPRLISRTVAPAGPDDDPDREIDAAIEGTLSRFDRPAVGGIAGLLGQSIEFLTSWPELDFAGTRAGRAYYGPLLSFGGTARPAWPTGDGPRTFLYMPFEHPAATALIELLGARGWPAIWHAQGTPPQALPPSIHYSPEPVDIDAILTEAAVLVGRAGHGLSSATLRHGVPSLVFPDTLEAGLVASCLIRAALAVMPRKPSGTAIAEGLDTLTTDPRIAAACAQIRLRYGRYDPVAAAKRMAADILATTRPATIS